MISSKLTYYSSLSLNGLLKSYSQIFFSNSNVLGFLLLLVSFFDSGAGLAGVICVLLCQLTALLFNFRHDAIRDGTYTYNALLVGIAIGIFYQFNFSILVLLMLVAVLTFFISIWFASSLSLKNLPFLSIPFLLVIWIVILGANNFSAFSLNKKEFISLAQSYPGIFYAATRLVSHFPFANAFYIYFRSLGAIFFQYNDLAGIFIAIGIVYFSRIAFVLSLYGFLLGYGFYYLLEGDFSQLIYSYIGFNFILTAIALGGFFIVPSRRSFLLLLFSIPLIALLISAFHTLFKQFGLPLYSLPFNVVVILLLYALRQRGFASGLHFVTVQNFSPEKNHYKFFNSVSRFKSDTWFHITLPFLGEWYVSQGHNGSITHKNDYRHALDFDVRDDSGKTFRAPGRNLKDYYCYDIPVTAPQAGYVVKVIDSIDDNVIGDVDINNNWGNTIIIKHGEALYSKLSHLLKGSISVKEGVYVAKGEVIAHCGSSGRSPEPHLHFQLQSTPYVGSKTLSYPLSYYLSKSPSELKFHSFDIPKEGETISNIRTTKLLLDAFSFIPGKTLEWQTNHNNVKENVKWEIFTNSLNQSYIYCYKTGSIAYFHNNGTLFYFTDFIGKKGSLLHHFYLAAHKVLLGYYTKISIIDQVQIEDVFASPIKFMHDFTAPFFHYCEGKYFSQFVKTDSEHNPSSITMKSSCAQIFFGTKLSSSEYVIEFSETKIKSLMLDGKNKFYAELIN